MIKSISLSIISLNLAPISGAAIIYHDDYRSIGLSGVVFDASSPTPPFEFRDSASFSPTSNYADFIINESLQISGPSSSVSPRATQNSFLTSSGGSFQGTTEIFVFNTLDPEAGAFSRFGVDFSVTATSILDISIESRSLTVDPVSGGNSLSLRESVSGSLLWASNPEGDGSDQPEEASINLEEGVIYRLTGSTSSATSFGENTKSHLNFSFSIPEPSTAMLVMGSLSFFGFRRR